MNTPSNIVTGRTQCKTPNFQVLPKRRYLYLGGAKLKKKRLIKKRRTSKTMMLAALYGNRKAQRSTQNRWVTPPAMRITLIGTTVPHMFHYADFSLMEKRIHDSITIEHSVLECMRASIR